MKNYSAYQTAPGTGRLYDPLGSMPQPARETSTVKSMSCDVVFGSPSNDCRGTGICKITARKSRPEQPARRDCKSAKSLFIAGENGRTLSMVFAREMLCIQIWRTQFRQGILTLQEPCTIPAEISRTMGLKFNTIRPGQYAIEEMEGRYRIKFSA